MTSYDHWKLTDTEGERREAEAEYMADRAASAWRALTFREKAEMIGSARFYYDTWVRNFGHRPYGYTRFELTHHRITERLL